MSDAALDILWGLVLGNGKAWGEVAIEQQKADALAIFAEERPHLHFITRPRGGSKPLALDTPIPTPGGWTTMGDIKCGDQIFDDGGHITRVVKVGEILLGEPCYRVTLADGSWLVASGNHEWVVQDRQIKANRGRDFTVTVTTEEMKERLHYGSRGDLRWGIPVAKPFDLPQADLPIPPYVLGAWLGDGNSESSRITVGDEDHPEMADLFGALGFPFVSAPLRKPDARCATWRFGNPLGLRSNGRGPSRYDAQVSLRRLGVLKNKHIPQAYLRASYEQRLALLRGLMDTDGHQSHSLSYFTSTSKQLADDVVELVISLGWKAWLSTSPAQLYGKDCGIAYRVGFRASDCPFALSRKAAKWTNLGAQASRSQNRTVVAVERVDSVPVRCIGVDSPSHLYLAGKAAIPTHNTTDIAGMAIAWLIADAGPMSRGYVVASNSEQAAHVIDAAAAFRARTPELDGIITVENEKIIVENGSWIRVLSLSDSGAWGLREARFLIADEFCQWPETRAAKRVYEAIRSTVQKETGCRLCILSSSGEPPHWSRATYDEALREQRMALEQGRPAMWRVSDMPGPVPWQDPDEIEQLRNELSPSAYDRLVLNIWSQDEDRAIAEEDFDIAAQKRFRVVHKVPTGLRGYGLNLRDPVPGEKYLMTVDIGIYRDATAICIAHKEPLDPAQPKGLQRVVVDHLERWSGSRKRPIQLQDVEDWIMAYSQRYNRCKVVCDPDQFIGNIQSLNRRGVRAVAFTFSSTSVGQIATALVQAFRNRQIWVPDYKGLRDELIRVRLRETAPGVTRLTHDKLKGHDDQAVVIALACHELLGKFGFGTSFRTFMQRDLEQREAIVKTPDSQYFQAVMRHQEQVRSLRSGVADTRKANLDKCVHRIRPSEVRCLMCGQIPG